MRGECWVILFDDVVKQGLFRPVTLVANRRPVTLGIPYRSSGRHDSRPCGTATGTAYQLDAKHRKPDHTFLAYIDAVGWLHIRIFHVPDQP
jgi:hypothetical protein